MHAIPQKTLKRMVQGYVNGMLANDSPEVKTSSKRARDNSRAVASSTMNKVVLERKLVETLNMCCTEFIDMVISESCEICSKANKGAKKNYVHGKHIVSALDELGFLEYKEYVTMQLEKLSSSAVVDNARKRMKKRRKMFKKKMSPAEEAQLAAEQEKLFQLSNK